jgi:hypothetical protein
MFSTDCPILCFEFCQLLPTKREFILEGKLPASHSPVYTPKPPVVALLQFANGAVSTGDSSIQGGTGDSPPNRNNFHLLLPVHCILFAASIAAHPYLLSTSKNRFTYQELHKRRWDCGTTSISSEVSRVVLLKPVTAISCW